MNERLGEAEAMRQLRIARARRARRTRVVGAASRARLLVAYGSTR